MDAEDWKEWLNIPATKEYFNVVLPSRRSELIETLIVTRGEDSERIKGRVEEVGFLSEQITYKDGGFYGA